jgi:hypothetical protein
MKTNTRMKSRKVNDVKSEGKSVLSSHSWVCIPCTKLGKVAINTPAGCHALGTITTAYARVNISLYLIPCSPKLA